MTHDPGVTEYTYDIPLASWVEGTRLFVAAHAVIKKLGDLGSPEPAPPDPVTMEAEVNGSRKEAVGVSQQEIDETSWASGLDFVGKDWAKYLSYTLQ